MLNRFLTKSIPIFADKTYFPAKNEQKSSFLAFFFESKMSFQGGKSLQRTFSLSPVSFFRKIKKIFVFSKFKNFSNFQKFHLEWTAVSEDANNDVRIYPEYDR